MNDEVQIHVILPKCEFDDRNLCVFCPIFYESKLVQEHDQALNSIMTIEAMQEEIALAFPKPGTIDWWNSDNDHF